MGYMKKNNMRKRVLLVVIAVVLAVLGGVVWWLFSSGHLVYSDTSSSQSKVACGTDIVDKYNAAMYYQLRNGSTEPSIDEQGVKDLVKDIKSKASFETDPTCQTIIFWVAVRDDNYKSASSAYNEIMSLHKKRIFADSNLRSDQPLFTYEETLKGLTESGSSKDGVFGG
jgi:hypothetical protein